VHHATGHKNCPRTFTVHITLPHNKKNTKNTGTWHRDQFLQSLCRALAVVVAVAVAVAVAVTVMMAAVVIGGGKGGGKGCRYRFS
jgi:hypothetical protein